MSMWTRLAYGTLVVAGLATTGVTIYQGAVRKQIKAIDIIELLEGTQERAATLGWTPSICTNRYPEYSPIAASYVHHYDGGTNPVTTNYLAWVTNAILVRTNWYINRIRDPIRDSYPIPDYTELQPSVQIGRTLETFGTQVVVTVDGAASTLYAIPATTLSTTDLWGGMPASVTAHFEGGGYLLATDGIRWYFSGLDSYGGFSLFWCFVSPAWEPIRTATPWKLSAFGLDDLPAGYIQITSTGTNVIEGSAREYGIANYAQGIQVSADVFKDMDDTILGMIPSFIERTNLVAGSYSNYFLTHTNATTLPKMAVSNTLARLGVGNKLNAFTTAPQTITPACSNWIFSYTTHFPCTIGWVPVGGGWELQTNDNPRAICYTDSTWQAVNYATNWNITNGYAWAVYSNAVPYWKPATTNGPEYGGTVSQINTQILWERFLVLNELRDTDSTHWFWTNSQQQAQMTNTTWTNSYDNWTYVGQSLWSPFPYWEAVYPDPATNGGLFLPIEPGGAFWAYSNTPTFDDVFDGTPAVTTSNLAPVRSYRAAFSQFRYQGVMSADYSSWGVNVARRHIAHLEWALTNRDAQVGFLIPQPANSNTCRTEVYGKITSGEPNRLLTFHDWTAGTNVTITVPERISTTNDVLAATNYPITGASSEFTGANYREWWFYQSMDYLPWPGLEVSKTISVCPLVNRWNFTRCVTNAP